MTADPVTAYALHVTSGARVGCEWERRACERHLEDIAAETYYFDRDAAAAAIALFPQFRHYKGLHAGQPFILHPSQQFIVGSIYGWRMSPGGPRRFTSAYIEIPRKAGKTTMAAGIGVLGLLEERGAEVYSVATKEDQAKLAWRDGRALIRSSPGLSRRFASRMKEIRWDERDAVWRPLGADSETLDGLNPSLAIMDELHAWTNRDLWDVIEDGMGARAQPLIFAITTAGSNHEGICVERRNLVCSILEKRIENDRVFGIIFAADKDDDPHDPATWRKANPTLGEAKSEEFMAEQSKLARQTPGKLNTFLTKQLNIWVQQEERWLDLDAWDRCKGDDPAPDLAGMECSAAGLDLSSTTDLTALVRLFRRPGLPALVVPTFWMPEDTLRAAVRRDRVPYDTWARQGHIIATPGNVVDYDFVRAEMRRMHEANPFKGVFFDRWNATQITTQLLADGVPMAGCGQGYATMSPAAKELERRIMQRSIDHLGNPVLRWMAGNVALERDAAGNIKPSKKKSRHRIDGIAAACMAVAFDMTQADAVAPAVSFSLL